jgi:hypothetical protein
MKNDKGDKHHKGDADAAPGPGEPPGSIGKSESPPNVTGIQDWKNRVSAKSARAMRCEQKIQLLSTPQKQALLIRLIVCDDITPKELDALLGVLVAHGRG